MQNLIDYLRDQNQIMETTRIPELQGQLRDLKYQYSKTGFWPWQDCDLKEQLNE